MAEKIATREAYGNALAEFGDKYDFVVLGLEKAPTMDGLKNHVPRLFVVADVYI